MIPKILSREQYYMLFAHFHMASEALKEVLKQCKLIVEILGEGLLSDAMTDYVYNPSTGSDKKEYDELLSKLGISIEWKTAQNEFAKEQRREEKQAVAES